MREFGRVIRPFIGDFTLRNALAARGSGRIFDARWLGLVALRGSQGKRGLESGR
jgi:hypothetical protein